MAWRIVKQPDGQLARFSDVVDNFTHFAMTVDEATDLCRESMSAIESQQKVQSGVDDIEPWTTTKKGSGLSRWNDCLNSIVMVHGYEGLKETLAKRKLSEFLPAIKYFKEYIIEE